MKLLEILENLQQPVPQELISQKILKGNRIDYVAWFDLCDILDSRCGLDNLQLPTVTKMQKIEQLPPGQLTREEWLQRKQSKQLVD